MTEHPRFTTVSGRRRQLGSDCRHVAWADLVADGTVKRVEIGVMPELRNADDETLALNAPSRTFDLGANAFADDFYPPDREGCGWLQQLP